MAASDISAIKLLAFTGPLPLTVGVVDTDIGVETACERRDPTGRPRVQTVRVVDRRFRDGVGPLAVVWRANRCEGRFVRRVCGAGIGVSSELLVLWRESQARLANDGFTRSPGGCGDGRR